MDSVMPVVKRRSIVIFGPTLAFWDVFHQSFTPSCFYFVPTYLLVIISRKISSVI
ncbi:hypothetical protein BS47DRAFT_1344776 [Hydnum rufescens UP504]|uniref:Uncharacterized protein n=1 Tax=Hydnum rufescens UP504 TaxID=1448309 RepID=A0A9P6AXA3_9AGAM|nr:hypothetical protein BS47DRAFT_1344776 [Hydnum rufescens UP504]